MLFQVIFVGEDAVDAGGVRKEFFLLIMRELLDPKYGMFRYYEDSRLIWFSDKTFEDSDLFHLIGVICGLAIYNFTIVDLHFPLALYKKLLKKKPSLDDLKELVPDVGRSMQQLLDYPEDDVEETFCLNFTNTEYKGEYWAEHPTIKIFWEVFHELPLEKKKQFLLFLTGSDRIPILGMKSLKLVIQSTGGGEEYLPVSHTCFNLLDLPKYKDKETLRSKLIQAIDHNEGFSLI